MEKRREKIPFDFITGTILIIILAAIFFTDGWNCAKYQVIGYDEGYNATVAANLAQTGEYKVSYPEDIVFYNRISTGAPVIVPAALVYHFFGINAVTTNMVPLLYGTLSIFLLYFLRKRQILRSLPNHAPLFIGGAYCNIQPEVLSTMA